MKKGNRKIGHKSGKEQGGRRKWPIKNINVNVKMNKMGLAWKVGTFHASNEKRRSNVGIMRG